MDTLVLLQRKLNMPSNVTWSAAHDVSSLFSCLPFSPPSQPSISHSLRPLRLSSRNMHPRDISYPGTVSANPQTALLTSLVSLILSNRREVYSAPGLSDVANNGGSRINQRLLLMLRKMCTDFGERGLVDELVRAQQAQKPGGARKRKSDKSDGDEEGEERKVKMERVEKVEKNKVKGDKDKGEKDGKGGKGETAGLSEVEMSAKSKDELRNEILLGNPDVKPSFQY